MHDQAVVWRRFLGLCCVCGILLAGRAGAADSSEQALTQASKSATLAGTLLVPAASGKLPVALIIAGSGPTDRDGNSTIPGFRSDNLKLLSEALARQGIASLRYDKRGIGASRVAVMSESAQRFDDLVDDAEAWIARLKADPRFSQVVVIGHSEGSLIGILAAPRAGASALVSVAGIADGASTVLRRQLAAKAPADVAAAAEPIMVSLEHGQTVADVPPALAMLFRPSIQPYWISMLKYAPAQQFAALRMPALIVQGTSDTQVSVDQAEKLKAAKPDAVLVIIPDMSHTLKQATLDPLQQKAAYGDPSLPLHPKLVPAIVDFVRGLPAGR